MTEGASSTRQSFRSPSTNLMIPPFLIMVAFPVGGCFAYHGPNHTLRVVGVVAGIIGVVLALWALWRMATMRLILDTDQGVYVGTFLRRRRWRPWTKIVAFELANTSTMNGGVCVAVRTSEDLILARGTASSSEKGYAGRCLAQCQRILADSHIHRGHPEAA